MAWRALRQLCPEYVPKGGLRGVTHLALENLTLEAGHVWLGRWFKKGWENYGKMMVNDG